MEINGYNLTPAGGRGKRGWAPLIRPVADGDRSVDEVYDWVGGELPKPATGYLGPTGLTADIAQATDRRGRLGRDPYELWKTLEGNEQKTFAQYLDTFRGTDGVVTQEFIDLAAQIAQDEQTITAARTQIQNLNALLFSLYGSFPMTTVAQLRAQLFDPTDQNSTVAPAYFVTDLGCLFKYSFPELGIDDGATILMDASANRWVKTDLFQDLYNRNR